MQGMAKNKKIFENAFAAATDHFIRISGINNEVLGDAVGYKKGKMIDAIRNERSFGTEVKRRAIAEYFGYGYENFLEIGDSIIEGDLSYLQYGMRHINQKNQDPTPTMTAQATTEPPAPPQRRKTDLEIQAEKEHQIIVTGFKDKKRMLKLNQMLITLEQRAPEKIDRIEDYLQGLLDGLPEEFGKLGNGTGTTGK